MVLKTCNMFFAFNVNLKTITTYAGVFCKPLNVTNVNMLATNGNCWKKLSQISMKRVFINVVLNDNCVKKYTTRGVLLYRIARVFKGEDADVIDLCLFC